MDNLIIDGQKLEIRADHGNRFSLINSSSFKHTLCHLTDHHIAVRGLRTRYLNVETVVSRDAHDNSLAYLSAAADGCSSKSSSSRVGICTSIYIKSPSFPPKAKRRWKNIIEFAFGGRFCGGCRCGSQSTRRGSQYEQGSANGAIVMSLTTNDKLDLWFLYTLSLRRVIHQRCINLNVCIGNSHSNNIRQLHLVRKQHTR